MDLRQLRYFVTVAEELHFGRAARRLAMTQPPLSQQIQALEAEIGVQLFVRTRRSVMLTPAGQQWLPEVRRVLADAGALPGLAQRLARGEVGSLALAFVSTADYGILPDLLRHFRARHPDVQLQLREATSDIQLEALVEGTIDAGLVIRPQLPVMPHGLSYLPLVREPLVLAVPDGWRPAGSDAVPQSVALRDAAREPLVIFPRRSAPAFYDIITGYYARDGLTPVIAQEAIQMQTIVSLVSAGMGVALVPASLRNLRRTGVSYLALRDAGPQIETGLAWREGAAGVAPVLRSFIDIATGLAGAIGLTHDHGINT
ncbi:MULTISPECIES: LysR family transcriptional regulator [unclassified Cupriavidus]|uniref:LysR family transcriptional regulator n=1 Tax=unclassified Cupriavidus TaxID=2640874 RepID=UPI001C007249|nr:MULTISPECIES: LysR family transcriptional regulator [unclassified Cupriavidus]MCA3182313.1 LysR family transcriptional regulator [Cupriavidus sp.]MCA3192909.1 LysR family transcriptional regulator [Cupriavidus sp.]MCA3195110.1 LysR family transcriptional regulator [Cupriavidus sp.]MCA3204080.1 LysR family transcriptional regulator [Cupriavidus sp.]QWE93910.1 LysR family transcriptional regulator [Cupriavidus sp. EM10]